LETVVENIQNVRKLSLQCANAFQVLRYLLSSPVLSTSGLKLLQLFPQLFFVGKLRAL